MLMNLRLFDQWLAGVEKKKAPGKVSELFKKKGHKEVAALWDQFIAVRKLMEVRLYSFCLVLLLLTSSAPGGCQESWEAASGTGTNGNPCSNNR